MVQRFKVGDRVRLAAERRNMPVGTLGTVAYVFASVDAYTIVFDDKTITVDEEHLLGGVRRVYEYKGSHRPTETYRLIENNSVEHHLDMPNSKRVAALQAEFESTPVTQELQWNGEAFIDVATGKVIDG